MSKFNPLPYIRSVGEHDLTTIQKAVLTQLAVYSNDRGIAFPGEERLARAISSTRVAVRGALHRLEEKHFIEKVGRHGGIRRDSYQILPLPELPQRAPHPDMARIPSEVPICTPWAVDDVLKKWGKMPDSALYRLALRHGLHPDQVDFLQQGEDYGN